MRKHKIKNRRFSLKRVLFIVLSTFLICNLLKSIPFTSAFDSFSSRETKDVCLNTATIAKVCFSPENITCSGYYNRTKEGFYQNCEYQIKLNKNTAFNLTMSKADISGINYTGKDYKNIVLGDIKIVKPIIRTEPTYDKTCLNEEYNLTAKPFSNITKCINGNINITESVLASIFSEKNITISSNTTLYGNFYVKYNSYGIFDFVMKILGNEIYIPLPTWNTTTQTDWNTGNFTNTTSESAGYIHLNQTEYYLDPSLKLLLHFNNDSTYNENSTWIKDFSGNGNNGTANGGVIFNTSGKFGASAQLDGANDCIRIPSSASINSSVHELTLAIWIKSANANSMSALIYRDGYFEGTMRSYDFGRDLTNIGGTNAWLTFFPNQQSSGWAFNMSLNAWHLYIGTYDGSNTKFYLDGIQNASNAITGNVSNGVTPITLGCYAGFVAPFTNGTIDEVAIWNRSLTATEIADLYRRNKGTYTSNFNTSGTFTNMSWQTNGTSITSNITMQFRCCPDTSCNGYNFTGALGTTTDYYTNSTLSILNLTNMGGAYCQYKAYFARNATGDPQLWNVSVNYNEAGDTTAPNLTIESPEAITYTTGNILINLTNSSDAQATWFYNGTGNTTYTIPRYQNFTEGSHTLYAYANDSSGNLNTTSVTFEVAFLKSYARDILPRQNIPIIYMNGSNEWDSPYIQLNRSISFT